MSDPNLTSTAIDVAKYHRSQLWKKTFLDGLKIEMFSNPEAVAEYAAEVHADLMEKAFAFFASTEAIDPRAQVDLLNRWLGPTLEGVQPFSGIDFSERTLGQIRDERVRDALRKREEKMREYTARPDYYVAGEHEVQPTDLANPTAAISPTLIDDPEERDE